jgi:16S rRNA processing protein RimM
MSSMTAPNKRNDRRLVALGRIVGTHGLRGALRVKFDNSGSATLDCVQRLFVDRDGEMVEYRVRSLARAGAGSVKMELEGVNTIDDAQAMRGLVLKVASEDLPALGANEFYYFEVIGLRVETSGGLGIGRIEEVFFNGANDVWVVKQGGREILVPVIEDVVRHIDIEGGRAIIDAIPGLLD